MASSLLIPRWFPATLVCVGVVAVAATGDACQVDGANRFSGATLRPGETSPVLAAKLSWSNDYGGRTGWLARRLFSLEDNVEVTGELVRGGDCIQQAGDDDLTFSIKLSPASYRRLSAYFSPPTATPLYIHVEMVASLQPLNGSVAFRTWRSASDRCQFAKGDTPFQDIQAAGDERHAVDWVFLKTPSDFKYVSVRGALVIDMAEGAPGVGGLEIHPAEYIRISTHPF